LNDIVAAQRGFIAECFVWITPCGCHCSQCTLRVVIETHAAYSFSVFLQIHDNVHSQNIKIKMDITQNLQFYQD